MAFTYDDIERRKVFDNSVERVFNTMLKVLARCPQNDDDVQQVTYDVTELKSVVSKVWNDKRDQFFKEGMSK